MKTISNIIPNPLNSNKILNSNYSTSRFATSDYNGKENTLVNKNYKANIAFNRIRESGEEFYLGGIGEVGLVMQNISFINNKIKEYKGTEIPLDGKYVSSTLYNQKDTSSKEYKVGNVDSVWYYDVSYGMINHGSFTNAYRKLPLYKYDIKDFDSIEDDYDEYDDGQLTDESNHDFNIMDYIYYCQDDTLDDITNSLKYNFFEELNQTDDLVDKKNIIKYPIYSNTYNDKIIYSLPLLSYKKFDNYYDCEFFIIIPKFNRYIINRTILKQVYDINLIYNNVKVSIKFGNGEIKEVLDPIIKFKDAVVYKFHKQWMFDYTFINNQEIIISLIDYGTDKQEDQVLVSKKVFFNIYKLMLYQGKYQNKDFRFLYNNYYPLKYPLLTKKKFLELNYVPYEDINDYSETELNSVNLKETIIDINKPNPDIIINNIYGNYAYLNTYIYHNFSEGNHLEEWFLKENANGLMVDSNPNDLTYSYFEFSIENPEIGNIMDDTICCYYKTFTNYDNDGILMSDYIKSIQYSNTYSMMNDENILVSRKFNNFNIYGMKQIIYIPYKFELDDLIDNNNLSLFEDYLYIYNLTNDDVKLYFTDESHTLCENTRIINVKSYYYKYYNPSRHDNYNIIIKNCLLNKYKLKFYQIYKPYLDKDDRIQTLRSNINSINNINSRITVINNFDLIDSNLINSNLMLVELDNLEIVKVPIYDYSIPLFGNIIVIENL